MYNLENFGFTDMMNCRTALRAIFDHRPATIGEAAERIVRFFRTELIDYQGRPACPLVRLFKTHPYTELDSELKNFARSIAPHADTVENLRCLVLLATAGDEEEWNSRHDSQGHRAIPLTSAKVIKEAPMISQLIQQLGIEISTVLQPDPQLLLESVEPGFNVFYVPEAQGSPYIVAQREFVRPFRIRSVIGFGGMVASGDLYAAILFSRVPISPEVADFFKVVGLNFKLAMLSLTGRPLFAEEG